MQVLVDYDRCDGMGLCMAAAPEVFEIDESGFMRVLVETPTERHAEAVREAIRRCPKSAIALDPAARGVT